MHYFLNLFDKRSFFWVGFKRLRLLILGILGYTFIFWSWCYNWFSKNTFMLYLMFRVKLFTWGDRLISFCAIWSHLLVINTTLGEWACGRLLEYWNWLHTFHTFRTLVLWVRSTTSPVRISLFFRCHFLQVSYVLIVDVIDFFFLNTAHRSVTFSLNMYWLSFVSIVLHLLLILHKVQCRCCWHFLTLFRLGYSI